LYVYFKLLVFTFLVRGFCGLIDIRKLNQSGYFVTLV
jgi:hypothetical protein